MCWLTSKRRGEQSSEFSINAPDPFKIPHSNSTIIFGGRTFVDLVACYTRGVKPEKETPGEAEEHVPPPPPEFSADQAEAATAVTWDKDASDGGRMKPTGSFEFSGEQEIYDDGVFRIHLPAELVCEKNGDEESMTFSIDGLPFRVEWTTIVLDKTQIEQMGGPVDTIEEVMRFFMPDLADDAPLRLFQLANGFQLASHGCIREEKYRACCQLAQFVDEDTLVGISVELTAPEEWENDPRLVGLQHFLKSSIRRAHCTLEEPRINSSAAWLHVEKIGVRFPAELGGMAYRYATDFECRLEGRGVCLSYTDEEGRKADIFIYDNGDDYIEPGAESEDVQMEMCSAVMEIWQIYQSSDLYLLRDTVTVYGEDLPFADQRYRIPPELTRMNRAVSTATLITAYRGAFVKIRFTPLPGEIQIRHRLLETFMNDLADVFAA